MDMRIGLVLAAISLVFLINPAYAYIDPASGSAIMSAVIGLFIALGILVKGYWFKLRSFFGFKLKVPKEKTDSEQS
jgi:hypothetical protein